MSHNHPGPARIWCSLIVSVVHFIPFSHYPLLIQFLQGHLTLGEEKSTSTDVETHHNDKILYFVYGFEWAVSLVQAYFDYHVLRASYALQRAEEEMCRLSESLHGAIGVKEASIISTDYFVVRKHHREIISLNKSWIFYSLMCDTVHLWCRATEYILKSDDPVKTLKRMLQPWKWTKNDVKCFVMSSWISLLSIPLNSIWYNLFVNTPSFKPRGITKVTMDVLNSI